MQEISRDRAQYIVQTVAPGHEVVSMTRASASFTNDVRVLECRDGTGAVVRLVVKLILDEHESAVVPSMSERASADYHALKLVRAHGIPAPEPIYLDEEGLILGAPGLVMRYVEGRQDADPQNTARWAEAQARLLLRIHDIKPSEEDRTYLFDGNDLALYFLRGEFPQKMGSHPLASVIFDAVEELRTGVVHVPPVLAHMDYWQGNVLWRENRISAILDWDAASYGDPALDVGYFRMNMYLRGIKEAADIFLKRYETDSGVVVENLGFWELAAVARPLPNPQDWIPASRGMGDAAAIDERAATDYYEFVSEAKRRAYAGR